LKKIEFIEKIEGEAKLHFSFQNNKIDFVQIEFFNTRNIENILKNKSPLDALVINPRVCGICNHAHLIATVKALEDTIDDIEISQKAKILREVTLNLEIIQNHFKWFYLTILPLMGLKQDVLKAMKPSQLVAKAIATLAGQYPHNSYAIVGGVVCDPTFIEIVKLRNYINDILKFFEQNMVQADAIEMLNCTNSQKLFAQNGDLPYILSKLVDSDMLTVGKSYDRFIVFGENSYFKRGKSIKTRVSKTIDEKFIREFETPNSLAKSVQYKDSYYEVGPLSRAMLNKTPLIKDMHRRYGDAMISRIVARVCEIPQLLNHTLYLVNHIDLTQPSYIKPCIDIQKHSGMGVGSVEAARGSLVHKVEISSGVIKDYHIITPTQWNLSNGSRDNLAIAQKAMVGLKDAKLAELVFKSFDVCSVCTTH
jgi:hydrogenase large subunit